MPNKFIYTQLFASGQIVATHAVAVVMSKKQDFRDFVNSALKRHFTGDWGYIPDANKNLNNLAIQHGTRILSAYTFGDIEIWIITDAADEEGKRLGTTVLFPSDY